MNHYTVYKITNLVNGKYYIGKHHCRCKNCVYMGSGKLIKAAINKHGIENFTKEILFVFETEDEMNKKEAELVTEELIASGTVYNLCPGGQGGAGVILMNTSLEERILNARKGRISANIILSKKHAFRLQTDADYKNRWLKKLRENNSKSFLGKTHSEETKEKMRKPKNGGSKNSQFGTMWITNGTENKKIKKDLDIIPEGWYKGRR